MSNPLRVLIIEDSESDAALVVRLLGQAGYDVHDERVESAGQMQAALTRQAWDVVIADYRLPQFDAPAALALLQQTGLDIPFIVVSGKVGEETAVAMMKAGAHDYLLKDRLSRLAPAVEREMREAQSRRERKQAEKQIIQLKRLYATLSQINQTIVRIKGRDELYQAICRVAAAYGEFSLAWIGLLDEKTGDVRPVASYGRELEQLPFQYININKAPFKKDLIGAALRESKIVTSEDIQSDRRMKHWQEQANIHHYHSQAAVPLQLRGRVFGVLNLYLNEAGFFKAEEELRLLQEISLDISFALDTIETETERRRTEEALQEREVRLKAIVENVGGIVWFIDAEYRLMMFNSAFVQGVRTVLGHEARLGETMPQEWLPPAMRDEWKTKYARALSGEAFQEEILVQVPSGDALYREYFFNPIIEADDRVIGIVCFSRDTTERKRTEQKLADYVAQLHALSQRLVETQETERRSLARELHDEVGQVMLAVKTNLETIQLAPDPATLNEQLADSVSIVSHALEQIRTLALNLRPSLLDDFGLAPTLEWHLEGQAKNASFQIRFQSNLPENRLPSIIETNCFRVVQAALTNIARHAQATQVEVSLHLLPDTQELEMSVRDDGLGFDVPAALKRARHGESLGLLGMQERIQLVGGQLTIESAPGRGTEIRVRVPLQKDERFA